MAKDGEPTYGVEVISRLLNLTPRRVQQLAKEGVIPKAGRGKYRLAPTVRGYVVYLQEKLDNPGAEGRINLNEERARKTKAEADLAEMEVAKRRGELIDTVDVKEAWQSILTEVRANLLHNVPVRIAAAAKAEDDEAALKSLVKAEIVEALRVISEKNGEELMGDETQ